MSAKNFFLFFFCFYWKWKIKNTHNLKKYQINMIHNSQKFYTKSIHVRRGAICLVINYHDKFYYTIAVQLD